MKIFHDKFISLSINKIVIRKKYRKIFLQQIYFSPQKNIHIHTNIHINIQAKKEKTKYLNDKVIYLSSAIECFKIEFNPFLQLEISIIFFNVKVISIYITEKVFLTIIAIYTITLIKIFHLSTQNK